MAGYKISVYYLDDEKEHVFFCRNKNEVIEKIIDLAFTGLVEELNWGKV